MDFTAISIQYLEDIFGIAPHNASWVCFFVLKGLEKVCFLVKNGSVLGLFFQILGLFHKLGTLLLRVFQIINLFLVLVFIIF